MRALGDVLVTGGAGFIGSNLVHRLLATRPDVRVVTLDRLTYAGDRRNLDGLPDPGRHTFVHGDIADRALVATLLRDHGITTVLHLAAESHVDRSIADASDFLHTNVVGTVALLEAASSVWGGDPRCRFHLVSTDEVYGDLDADAPPAREGDPYRPSSPYAASKAAADHMVLAWRRTHGVPVSISHGTNTYGPRQHPEKLLPTVMRTALVGAPIPLYGDGLQERDWIYVDDHVDAILAVAERGREGDAYHVSGGQPWRNLDLVTTLCAALDEAVPAGRPHARWITHVADRPGHDRRYALDDRRLREHLGWAPRVSLEDGLRRTVQWWLTRDDDLR